ncbi:NlpC/P60 family protein [Foetidibacter luteolus]|uniref:NlpC/P60 family protein n=1 Tax=Foetidibacter luteolus TaxID=2608880 RepID=UPI001A9A1476|nr:NlpC/P60 family protein [Foetidibacter luteolus]
MRRLMNWKSIIYSISFAALLTSCKSFKSASSGSNTSTAKKSKDPRFLGDINVTPGGVKYPSTAEPKRIEKKAKVTHVKPDVALTNFDIEKADWLQLKYAIVLDATVEKLTNLSLLQNIDKWWGTRYCMGGVTDRCIDCSAFTQIMLRDVYSTDIPRTAQEQYDQSTRIELEDLEEGDLVFFHTTGGDITHVGIYLFNNKFVHAATSTGVSVSDLNDTYWKPRYRGAGRVGKQ